MSEKSAYRKARRASQLLDDAARELGADNVHDLALTVGEGEYSRRKDDGVRAITNAHSYLNNGMLEGLVSDE